ncbi:MAG: hypothetical protein IPL61_22485 [Myxococcales bacterium]|nr:hypothetical protein [Myxococcales bacterium]
MAVAACRAAPPPPARPGPAGLAAFIGRLVGHDRAAVTAAVAATALDPATWVTVVSGPYRDHHAAYARAFPGATAGLVAALVAGGAVAVRPHYADDPGLTAGLRRERLAVPVGRPGWIVTVGGRDLPVVFVWAGARWRTLAGIDALTRDVIGAADHDCAVAYAAARAGRCLDASAPVAVAALTGRADERAIACRRLIALAGAGACEDRGSVAPAATP